MSSVDDDPAPSPPPADPSAGSGRPTSGPAGYPVGGFPPGGSSAPAYPTRDPSDPLGPEKLRAAEINVGQAIAFYNRLLRIARNPSGEPGYRQVIAALVQYQGQYRDLNAMAEVAYDRAVRERDLIAKLDMTRLENIKAYADAAASADSALVTWKQVYTTYGEIHACLSGPEASTGASAPAARRLADLSG